MCNTRVLKPADSILCLCLKRDLVLLLLHQRFTQVQLVLNHYSYTLPRAEQGSLSQRGGSAKRCSLRKKKLVKNQYSAAIAGAS